MTIYNDIKKLGSGGFGEVTLCERENDGHRFAKKQLINLSPDAVARFQREVRLLSSLDHPNVVKVLGQNLVEPPYFYVMPIYNVSLDAILEELAVDSKRIEEVFGRVLDGVAYAHEQGVIHRDLKPQNVLLNNDSDLVVSDFGLGRQLDSHSTRQTSTGVGMGTLLYMAPEQYANAKAVDARSDVFALGRMLIELFTGVLSLGTQDVSAIPARVLPLVKRATHYDPAERFASAVDFRNSWIQTWNVAVQTEGIDSLAALTADFSAMPDVSEQGIDSLVKAFGACLNDPDEIHSAIMKLYSHVIIIAFRFHQSEMENVMDVFCENISNQEFSFEFTDSIASRCTEIFNGITSSRTRAKIVASVSKLGVLHNRWNVMASAGKMLTKLQSEADVLASINSIAELSDRIRHQISAYTELAKVDHRIRQLLTVPT